MPPAQILEKNTIRQITFNLYAPFIQEAALSGTVTAGGVLIIITYISHAGGDNLPTRSGWSRRDFNPRLSCRRRPNSVGSHCYGSGKISIHTFLAEGDRKNKQIYTSPIVKYLQIPANFLSYPPYFPPFLLAFSLTFKVRISPKSHVHYWFAPSLSSISIICTLPRQIILQF